MNKTKEKKIEFIAKTVTDIGKAIFIVGLAGYFFEKFHFVLRVIISLLSVVLVFAGIFMYPEDGGKE